MNRPQAVLIVGPSGSGKTPFGDYLEETGLWGRECVHFDFGRQLRQAVRRRPNEVLTPEELQFLEEVLREGKLLEDRYFHIARKVLLHFIRSHSTKVGSGHLLVLNGLPRHVGQARDLDGLVDIRAIVELDCPPGVCRERIATNAGGDREHRNDDRVHAVRRRHQDFERRTRPVVDYYRSKGTEVVTVPVGMCTGPAELATAAERARDLL